MVHGLNVVPRVSKRASWKTGKDCGDLNLFQNGGRWANRYEWHKSEAKRANFRLTVFSKCLKIAVLFATKSFIAKMVTRYRANCPRMKQWLMHGSGQFEEKLAAIFRPQKNSRVCSRHFKENDYKTTLAGKRKPNDYAVPSIFFMEEKLAQDAKAALSA